MKIHINRVPEEGLHEQATYDPAALDMDREDIHLREPVTVEANIHLVERELVVRADIQVALQMTCARCLEEFTLAVQHDGIFTYAVGSKDVVDITDDVRQEIILEYPMVPICRTDCKGLCSACGQNLNQTACEHQASRT